MGQAADWLKGIGRPIAIWFGSFLVAATFLIMYCHTPLAPLLIAGALTLIGTVIRSIVTRNRSL